MTGAFRLVTRKTIGASPQRIFAAWTRPETLVKWWGPKGVRCIGAEIDLRVGGRYRIANSFPDGTCIWITGLYEAIDPPRELVFSWQLEGAAETDERVTVRLEPGESADETVVVVTHERIANKELRDRHAEGWQGCLDGLWFYFRMPPP